MNSALARKMESQFYEPSKEDYTDLGKRWISISNLIKEDYGYELNQSYEDLKYLQRVIDDETIDFKNGYATECLGFAFGRVLAKNEEGLDWWVVVDDFGRDIVIRYKETSLQIAAMDILAKRLEVGTKPDVEDLYFGLTRWVKEAIVEGKFS